MMLHRNNGVNWDKRRLRDWFHINYRSNFDLKGMSLGNKDDNRWIKSSEMQAEK
jgi:hypothetical protein